MTIEGAATRAHVVQLALSTLPVFLVLCYFLYLAHQRPNDPYYSDDIDDDVTLREIGAPKFELMEMLWVFLTILCLWTALLIYLAIFVPKRRSLLSLYMEDAEKVKGDVMFDNEASCCDYKPTWCLWNCSACFGLYSQQFSDIVYTIDVPDKNGNTSKGTVTKVVRTFKPWYRERVWILVLPGMPKSGLPMSDVETDVKSQGRNRIFEMYFVIGFWMVFLTLGALYIVFQIVKVHDDELAKTAWITYALMVGLHVPAVYILNFIRFLHYKTWLTNSGTLQIDESSPRHKAPDPEDPDGYNVLS